ncbi:hypothetical protein B0H11DRAFT_2066568 [Mycena galericulata]|nr:hypothetical protein B0H11DRAFT_2066568 [Mycena galericulata]
MSSAGVCSLTDLPTELLVEIGSYHPHPFTFLSPLVRHEQGAQERHDHQRTARSLSQTCSVLRGIFLPMAWETFEVSTVASLQEHHINSTLVSRLFPYVKTVRISMKKWSINDMESVFLFVRFLCALPNAAGLHIYDVAWGVVPVLSYAFADVSLPTITALSVPDTLDQIFPAFPNVTTLACPSIYARSTVFEPAQRFFPRLEAIAGLRLSKPLVQTVLARFPRLRAISVNSTIPVESSKPKPPPSHSYPDDHQYDPDFTDLALLQGFTHLSQLSLIHEATADAVAVPLDELIEKGTEILRASKATEPKVLRIWSYDLYKGYNVSPCVVFVK